MEEGKNTVIKINKENWKNHQLVVPVRATHELILGWRENITKLAQLLVGFYKKFSFLAKSVGKNSTLA